MVFSLRPGSGVFAQLRQTGGRHGLADTARFLIRQHDAHLLRKLRIFLVQDGQAGLENDAAAEAGHDAAEHDHVVHVVEAAVQLQRMGQICADGGEDPAGAAVALLHEVLHDLELFSGRERGIQLDAGARRELDDGILREILAADADVRGPLVRHGVLKEVDRRKGADSLDTVELIMEFEKAFDIQIPDEDAEKIATVGDAISYIEAHKK